MTKIQSNCTASTVKSTFYQQTTVNIDIKADHAIVWALLTNVSDYTRWNSTITSLDGEIKLGGKIKLKSYLDNKRTFKIKIKEFEPEKRMVWGDNQGNRVFILTDNGDGSLNFEMTEKIGGLMYPLYAKYLPPFKESFEKFALDLKKEAETIANQQ